MAMVGRISQGVLVGFLILSLTLPFPAWGAAAALGTARGVRTVELSLDGGTSWLPLGTRSLPVMDGTHVRSTNGGAILDFGDGSRLNLLPFTAIRIRETGVTTEVSFVYGRLTFRLPRETRVEIRTPLARLEPVRTQPMVGEVFAAREGAMGLRMSQGALQVHELAGGQPVRLASTEPVFLPKRPATSMPLFTSEGVATPPANAKGVFSPKGESLGYLRPDGQLVVHPGFTSDLTQSYPAKLVQLAMAKMPEKDRQDGLPLFDVNGGYVGYVAGPVFYAQAQLAQAQLTPAGEAGIPTWVYVVGALVLVGGGIGGLAAAGAFDEDEGGVVTATQVRPKR